MRKILLTATAVAALGLASPLFAQNAAAPATTAPAADQAAPAATGAATTAPAVKPKFINQQADNQWLATSIIGSTVSSPTDENLGDVNDIILASDGSPFALVVGVGGFLGIGEKNVAISYDAIKTSTDADGKLKLTLDTTKEELDAAPAFTTVAMLKQQQQLDNADQNGLQPAAPAMPAPAPVQ